MDVCDKSMTAAEYEAMNSTAMSYEDYDAIDCGDSYCGGHQCLAAPDLCKGWYQRGGFALVFSAFPVAISQFDGANVFAVRQSPIDQGYFCFASDTIDNLHNIGCEMETTATLADDDSHCVIHMSDSLAQKYWIANRFSLTKKKLT